MTNGSPSDDSSSAGLVLQVRGTPHAQPRPRFVRRGRGPVRVVSTASKGAQLWRDAVERAALEAVRNVGGPEAVRAMFPGAVQIRLLFTFQGAPEGAPHTGKPDTDNLTKLVLDALVRAGAIGGDDCRAATVDARKMVGGSAGCSIEVRPLSGLPSPFKWHVDKPDWLGQSVL